MNRLLVAALAVGVTAGAGRAAAQSARAPMTVESFLAVRAVSDPQPSPDGRLLANAGADGRIRVWAL